MTSLTWMSLLTVRTGLHHQLMLSQSGQNPRDAPQWYVGALTQRLTVKLLTWQWDDVDLLFNVIKACVWVSARTTCINISVRWGCKKSGKMSGLLPFTEWNVHLDITTVCRVDKTWLSHPKSLTTKALAHPCGVSFRLQMISYWCKLTLFLFLSNTWITSYPVIGFRHLNTCKVER